MTINSTTMFIGAVNTAGTHVFRTQVSMGTIVASTTIYTKIIQMGTNIVFLNLIG